MKPIMILVFGIYVRSVSIKLLIRIIALIRKPILINLSKTITTEANRNKNIQSLFQKQKSRTEYETRNNIGNRILSAHPVRSIIVILLFTSSRGILYFIIFIWRDVAQYLIAKNQKARSKLIKKPNETTSSQISRENGKWYP